MRAQLLGLPVAVLAAVVTGRKLPPRRTPKDAPHKPPLVQTTTVEFMFLKVWLWSYAYSCTLLVFIYLFVFVINVYRIVCHSRSQWVA